MTALTGNRYQPPIVTDRKASQHGLATVVPRADFDRFEAIARARKTTKGALLREVVRQFVAQERPSEIWSEMWSRPFDFSQEPK